jgi:hypothetical protein
MKFNLPFVPAVHFDEPVAPYLRRVSPHWAKGGTTGVSARSLDTSIRQMSIAVPSLTPLMDLAKQLTGFNLATIVQQHTLWPIATLLARSQAGSCEHESPRHEAIEQCGTEIPRFNLPKTTMSTSTWRFGICCECIEADRRGYGFATWRRMHSLSDLRVCPEHGSELYDYCEPCSASRTVISIKTAEPRLKCVCGGSLESRMIRSHATAVCTAEHGIARMLPALLKIGVHARRGARHILADVYRRQAKRLGLAFTTHYPALIEYYDLLCATLGSEFLESRGYGMHEAGSLMRPFSPHVGRPDPVAHAIMAFVLFSDPTLFHAEVVSEIESKKLFI